MEEIVEKEFNKGRSFSTGNIFRRILFYLPIWALMQFFWIMFLSSIDGIDDMLNQFVELLLIVSVPLILPALLEIMIYRQRKPRGLTYFGNVSKEWKQEYMAHLIKNRREVEERVDIETGKGSGSDKSDIRYWHGLLKDGIINESEFESKKAELLHSK